MREIFEVSFSTINLIPTILLIFVMLYWIIVLFGLIDLSSIDIDLDTDADVGDSDIGAGGHGLVLQSLAFFNVGKIPFMLLLSFFAIPLWFISLTVNYYLQNTSVVISLILLIPEIFVSLFVAKIISMPIANLFGEIDNKTGKIADYTGKIAEVRITVEKDRIGQIELNIDNSHILLNAVSVEGIIKSGEKILIIDYIEEKNYYLVEPF